MTGLPGRCDTCYVSVWWSRGAWREPNRAGKLLPHVCRTEWPWCAEWMPVAQERCARRPGHASEHRTAYALENARGRVA